MKIVSFFWQLFLFFCKDSNRANQLKILIESCLQICWSSKQPILDLVSAQSKVDTHCRVFEVIFSQRWALPCATNNSGVTAHNKIGIQCIVALWKKMTQIVSQLTSVTCIKSNQSNIAQTIVQTKFLQFFTVSHKYVSLRTTRSVCTVIMCLPIIGVVEINLIYISASLYAFSIHSFWSS